MERKKQEDSLTEKQKQYLSELYGNPKKVGSLAGPESLYKAARREGKFKFTLKQIKDWLRSSDTYTLHKPLNRKFKRERVIVGDINQEWQADLADMSWLRKANKNFKYFLLVIDVFSKMVRTAPLKSTTGKEVTEAFAKMLPSRKDIPVTLQMDKGSEFVNATFQNLLKQHKIKHFFTSSELKAMVSERAIKTIKLKLYKYFTESRKLNWIEHLKTVTDTYNRTVHRSIGMAPIDVTPSKTAQVWEKLFPEPPMEDPEDFHFNIDDKVRISFLKTPFERAYNYFWTGEIFIVTERFHRQNIAKYRLKDWNNEPIEGTFYTQELQKIDVDENTKYKIEKILGRRIRNGQRQVRVRWYQWPSKYDTWIPANSIENYS